MARFNYRETAENPPQISGGRGDNWLQNRPELPYVAPLFAYLLVMLPGSVGGILGGRWQTLANDWLPVTYPVKSILAAALLWIFWPYYTRIRWTKLGIGALVGAIGTLLWIGTELLCRHIGLAAKPTDADIYNPDVLGGGWIELLFLCARVAGPTLVVPLMEELFFRDFVMRAFVRWDRFEDVPVGTFTWRSLIGMSALFGLNHGRMFMAGIVYGLLMGVLLIRTKSLGACIVAHGVTNFTLYLYVIYSGDWQFM
jgi:uncharacterized protein